MLRTGQKVLREIVGVAAAVPWPVGVLLAPAAYLVCDALARVARLQLAVHDPAMIQVPLELMLAFMTVMKVALPLLLLLISLMSALYDPHRAASLPSADPVCPRCGAVVEESEGWIPGSCCDAAGG